jgi:hypothetical protein
VLQVGIAARAHLSNQLRTQGNAVSATWAARNPERKCEQARQRQPTRSSSGTYLATVGRLGGGEGPPHEIVAEDGVPRQRAGEHERGR